MEAVAKYRHARLSAQKGRLVADQIRSLPVEQALDILAFAKTKSAAIMKKVLDSAIANAENNLGADIDELKVSAVCVDEGPTMKRIRARANRKQRRMPTGSRSRSRCDSEMSPGRRVRSIN